MSNKLSFNLLELLLVLSTLALISTISLLKILPEEKVNKIQEQKNRENFHEIRTSIIKFFHDMGRLPKNINELITKPDDKEYFSDNLEHNSFIQRMTGITPPKWHGPYLSYLNKHNNSKANYTDGYNNLIGENNLTLYRHTENNTYFYTNHHELEEITIKPENFGFIFSSNIINSQYIQSINNISKTISIESTQKIENNFHKNYKNIIFRIKRRRFLYPL